MKKLSITITVPDECDDIAPEIIFDDFANSLTHNWQIELSDDADTQRLDWLENNGEPFRLTYEHGFPTMNNSHPPRWRFWSFNEGTTHRPTAREAIDAAMKGEMP